MMAAIEPMTQTSDISDVISNSQTTRENPASTVSVMRAQF